MDSRERLFACIDGKPVDRTPNTNIIMTLAAKEMGVKYSDYVTDHRLLVDGNIAIAEKYGLDLVTVMSDPMHEAHDVGVDVVFPEDDVPYPRCNLINCAEDVLKLKTVKPEDGERMSESVKAVELYRKKLGDSYPVCGWVEGCFAEAADLMGVNEFLMELMDEEGYADDLLEFCLEQAVLYAKAQVDAGADIIGVGDAIASVAGPYLYEDKAVVFETRLFRAIKDMGARIKLHICGNITPFIDKIPTDLIDILDVDWMNPIEKAAEACRGKCAFSGNYDPVGVLLQSDPAAISDTVEKLIRANSAERYITSAGCEVPKDTPEENLMAVSETVKRMFG